MKLVTRLQERLDILKGIEYVDQYQDRDEKLIFRYDNTAHKPALGSPEHKHVAGGDIELNCSTRNV